MWEDKPIEIRIKKIIHAPAWRIMRQLTRVEEFPKFVPSVKEAEVISKDHNVMRTRWRVQVDGVPVEWVEEETLILSKGMVYFQAVSGDLQDFSGTWYFRPHPEGTEIEVEARLSLNIPIIKDFAVDYMRRLLTANFSAIIDGLEQRLVSLRYSNYKKEQMQLTLAGFGIVGHLYNYVHLEKSLRQMNPNMKLPSRDFLSRLFHVSPSFKLQDINNFKSSSGATVNGCFIIATFVPDMLDEDVWGVFSKVVKACKIAEKHGVGVVSLGGFASIVADRIGQEVACEVDVAVTSGNTLAACMAIDGISKASALVGRQLEDSTLAIVGAGGDIGIACARVMVDKVRSLILSDRIKARLIQLKSELVKKRCPVTITTDNKQAVQDADIVITCASATSSIIPAEWFKPGAIVCDVGYPHNVSYSPALRNDLLIFTGGLCKIPQPISLPLDIGLPSSDTLYGCFAESMVLALENRFERYSFGRGNIFPDKIEQMRQMARKHGFEVADFWWENTPVSNEVIDRVSRIIAGRG